MNDYFSDRENGARPRTQQIISPTVWSGVTALVQGLIHNGSLGFKFSERCPDGSAICGCDSKLLEAAVIAEMPGLAWPLETTRQIQDDDFFTRDEPFAPETLLILDFIEFVHKNVAKPIPIKYHDYFSHHHLNFDQYEGQVEFRENVNRIFARNGLGFELLETGKFIRLLPLVLGDELKNLSFNSGDKTLDNMLEESRIKFSEPNPLIRREALERLWDAWERLKSLAHPTDKKQSVQIILNGTAPDPYIRSRLESEAKELNSIGNSHLIRHSELNQIAVVDIDHVDYLFHRLFAMINLMLKKK